MKSDKNKKRLWAAGLILCLLLLVILLGGSVSHQSEAVPENPLHGISKERSQVVYRGKGFYTPAVSGDGKDTPQLLNTEVLASEEPEEKSDEENPAEEQQETEDFQDDGSGDSTSDGGGESENVSATDETGANTSDEDGDGAPVTETFGDSEADISQDHGNSADDDRNQQNAVLPTPTETPQDTPEPVDYRPTISSDLTDGETIHKESRVFSVYAEDYKERALTSSQLNVTCNGKKLSSISTDNGVIRYKAYLDDNNEISITATDRYGNTDTVSVTVYKEITGNEEEEKPAGTITFSLEASTIGLGNIIGPVEVPFYDEETLPYVLNRVLYSAGCQYHFTGSMDSGFYLKSVDRAGITDGYESPSQIEEHLEEVNDIPDPDTCSPDWLGEGTLTGGSGWMFSVNGTYLSTGMNTYFPADGDVIRVRFTLHYGADIGEAMLGGETWGDW